MKDFYKAITSIALFGAIAVIGSVNAGVGFMSILAAILIMIIIWDS